MLNSSQLSSLQSSLQSLKREYETLLDHSEHFDTNQALVQESVSELSNYDNHPADHGTELYEREKDIALNDHIEKGLQDVNTALERMESGTYGKCDACGKDIPYERLEAMPTTLFCVEHSPDTGVTQRRPIEETILGKPFIRFTNDDGHDATFYDAEDSWQDVARYGTSNTPSDFNDPENRTYDNMFIDNQDPVSSVEELEDFIGTDIHGNNVTVYPNIMHERYESVLDEEYEESIDQMDSNVKNMLD